jgi:uncharacterized membrane protein YcaP (DUF421 family)
MEIVARGSDVVLFTLRMTTRKIIRTSTPLDMVVIFLVGGMAVQAGLGGDQSLTGVMLGISTVAGIALALAVGGHD